MKARDLLSEDYLGIDASDSISSLIGKLTKEEVREAFVFDEEDLIGMVLPPILLSSRLDIASEKIRNLSLSVPILSGEEGLDEVARLMFNSNATALPVMRDGKMMGAVHVFDIFRNINILDGGDEEIRDVRHPDSVTVAEEDRLGKALKVMKEENVGGLPVVDAEGKLSGFLSQTNILENYYSHHLTREHGMKPDIDTTAFEGEKPDMMALPVKSFMNRTDSVTIKDDSTVREAAEKMVGENVMSLLIMEGERPDNIVTKRDILEAIMRPETVEVRNIRYKGWNDLVVDGFIEEQARQVVETYADKMSHYVHDEFDLTVHVKQYEKGGERRKYSVKARISYPGATIASDSHAWDFRRALHKALEALEERLRGKYKKEKGIGRPTPRKTN